MKIESIKQAHELLMQLESLKKRLDEIRKSNSVDILKISHYQSGNPAISYDVELRCHEDKEFLIIIKGMIEARLLSKIESLHKQIESI